MKLIIFLLAINSFVLADEIEFFGSKIDYWKKSKNPPKKQSKKVGKKFDWKRHLDPAHDDFFREGNHLPPAPFMEVARRPNDQNIKNYFAYIKLKNEMSTKLYKALASYQKRHGQKWDQKTQNYFGQRMKELPKIKIPKGKINISTYFLTTCPSCKAMFKTLETLYQNGIYVEAIQIDPKNRLKMGPLFPVRMASKKEVQGLKASGLAVPYSIVRSNKKAFPIQGHQSANSLLAIINKKF